MKVSSIVNVGWIVPLLTIGIACSKGASSEPAPKKAEPAPSAQSSHSDEPEHDELPKRVHLTPKVIANAKITTALTVREQLSVTVALPGELVADPDRSARVSSPVAGRLVQVKLTEGSTVKKGDALAVIRVPELGKVRGALAATLSKAASARSNADRLAALADKGLAAKQEAVQARAEADALDAEGTALRDQLAALGSGGAGGGAELVLRAPVGGVIISRDAVVGQPVTAEQTIASIADLRELWFLGRVFEKDLGRLRVGATAEVELNAYPKERFTGAVEYLGQQVDPVARTVTARVRLVNRNDTLRIGLFGSAHVSVAEAAKNGPVLVVPRTALAEVGNKTVVFVRHADDDFELHEVVVGDSAPGKVEIVSGLREGEAVVVEGVFTLKSAVLKSTLAEDD